MDGKKQLVAQLSAVAGVTRLLEALPGRASLIILTYHRIGNAGRTPYDSGTFSCTTAEFDEQIGYLARRFSIVNLKQAISVVHGDASPSKPSILVTFDDGYLDNYREAFPVLRRHNASATFFLPTAFIGSGTLPWWDRIAYVVKHSDKSRISLAWPESVSFDLTEGQIDRSIRRILALFKQPSMTDAEAFLRQLEAACGSRPPLNNAERCFLNWDEAREMERAGMCFGSHTHTHEILSKLSPARQLEELRTSRAILELELGHPVDTLAYPVGKRESFSNETLHALDQAGYRTAFSFYSGINRPGGIEPYDVRRCGVDRESSAMFRLRLAIRAATGNESI